MFGLWPFLRGERSPWDYKRLFDTDRGLRQKNRHFLFLFQVNRLGTSTLKGNVHLHTKVNFDTLVVPGFRVIICAEINL